MTRFLFVLILLVAILFIFWNINKKHGYERWFYENGQVKSEQQFLHGQPEKEITRWKPDGTLVY